MEGFLLRFYVHEQSRVHGRPVWEWLLEEARRLGVRGGSVFRAMAGYGRDRVLHEERFFELAGTVTIEVEFVVTDDEATRLLEVVKDAELRLFHARVPARFGITGDPGA